MPYTRRNLIRDAALASLASTTSSFALDPRQPRAFPDGIRVFFVGAWLFCADPNSADRIRAVTINPEEIPAPVDGKQPFPISSGMGHNYPYGVWDKYEGWDQRMPYLPPNPIAQPISAVVPYTASVFGHYIRRYKTVDTLLRAANTSSRLLYIKNSDRSYQVDWSCPALRVISLPLPTKLIPAGFRTNASISDNNSTYTNIGSTTCGDNGVATSHIFEYSGASSFTFTTPGAKGGTEQMIHGTNYESDFHFHTVPSANQLPPDHDAMMFHVLLSAIKSFPCDKVSLKTPDDSAFTIGKQLPASVGRPELELPGIGLGGTGSCAGGGAALGGDSGT